MFDGREKLMNYKPSSNNQSSDPNKKKIDHPKQLIGVAGFEISDKARKALQNMKDE